MDILNDEKSPLIVKEIELGDYVVNVSTVEDIVEMSVGVVKGVKAGIADVLFIGKTVNRQVNINNLVVIDVEKTGKPYKYKICNVCHILKEDYVDFQINQTDALGRKTTRPSCNSCREVIDGVKLSRYEKKKMEMNKPHQVYICPICQKASIPFVTANYVIDHNHATGQAREWICDSCNTGLGRFKDDIVIMQRAIEYLKKHNQD